MPLSFLWHGALVGDKSQDFSKDLCAVRERAEPKASPRPLLFFFGLVFIFPTWNYSITPAGPHSCHLGSGGLFLFGEEAVPRVSPVSLRMRTRTLVSLRSGEGSFPVSQVPLPGSCCIWFSCPPVHAGTTERGATWAWHRAAHRALGCSVSATLPRSLYASNFLSLVN